MMVELGPIDASEVRSWTRFARRIVTELRTNPTDLYGIATEDFLDQWSKLIEDWGQRAATTETFRYSQALESERAEFLLHGLNRCTRSPGLRARITDEEFEQHRPFTLHLIRGFIDALAAEGEPYDQWAETLRASLGSSLD